MISLPLISLPLISLPLISLPLIISLSVLLLFVLGYWGVPLWAWSLYLTFVLFAFAAPIWLWMIWGAVAIVLNVPWLRRTLISTPILQGMQSRHLLPQISDTEQVAIDAGTVWIEGEFFAGQPNFQRLLEQPYPEPNAELQAFLDGPVEQVCRMATDWEIHRRKDLPPAVWQSLKEAGFLGMLIPQEYGGLGFSNLDYSTIMVKLASRSFIYTATVGVTNSLGPAKLLLSYGTAAQKDYYLPRLARGIEIPCFALTEPTAGSDAASITSQGTVFRGEDGKAYLRLNFRKRYITLGAIATLIGLAFRLYDPDNLLGKGKDVGITCALVPASTPGITLGKRHDPMGIPFYNSPIEGQDVIISVDQIIGGVEQAGQGWKMLMQSLAAGRGISFPASCTGIAKFVTRVTSAHALVRQQFGLSIGRFEGIEAPLARIAGMTYLMEAARVYTCAAVDRGEKPSVVSAIAKYQFTELARKLVNDGMDILGGAGICRGPRNLLANIYTAMPIPITVEGSNILTRTLMIFGQGVIRCHPYLYAEVKAVQENDSVAFDRLLWQHLGFICRNIFRTLLLSLSRGAIARAPVSGSTARYYRQLAWASAQFALLTDLALLCFGGSLKRHEKITGRFADMVSWLYLSTAALRRFEAEGRTEDLPLVHWALQFSLTQIQQATEGLWSNLPIPAPVRAILLMSCRLNPIGQSPRDRLESQIAQQIQKPGLERDRLTAGIYLPTHPDEALGRLEQAFVLCTQAESASKTLKTAMRQGQFAPRFTESPDSRQQLFNQRLSEQGLFEQQLNAAVEAEIISAIDAQFIRVAETARQAAIQVDTFTLAEYQLL